MSYIEAVIRKCVNDIWGEYDKDGSNQLDKSETKRFVTDILKEMGDGGQFSEQEFEDCFKEFDTSGDGHIDREEMAIFIKKIAGF